MAGPPATRPRTWPRSRNEPLTSLRAATSAPGNPGGPRRGRSAGREIPEGGAVCRGTDNPSPRGRPQPLESDAGRGSPGHRHLHPRVSHWSRTPGLEQGLPGYGGHLAGDLPRHHSRHGGHRAGRDRTGSVRNRGNEDGQAHGRAHFRTRKHSQVTVQFAQLSWN